MASLCHLVKLKSSREMGDLARRGTIACPVEVALEPGAWALLRVRYATVAAKRAKTPKAKVRKKKSKLFCYTKDLTEALGVTRRTLYKYVQERLLPAPILYSDGRNGVRSRWTLVAMDHVEFINEQKALGYNLAEITGMVAARWGTHDKLPAKEASAKPPKVDTGHLPSGEDSAAAPSTRAAP